MRVRVKAFGPPFSRCARLPQDVGFHMTRRKYMHRFVSIFVGFILLGFLCSCSNLAAESNTRPVDDNKPNYDEFVSTQTFPYVAPTKRRTRIKQNYSRLATGLTKDQVSRNLGRARLLTADIRLLHGFNSTVWPLLMEAKKRGYDARIGFEDTLYLTNQQKAKNNAELIDAAKKLLTEEA
jgi:hypothetical protein